MGNVKHKPQTICFKCKTPSPTCPWKYNFTPVEGWEAEETELKIAKSSSSTCKTYNVKSCPLFTDNDRVVEDIPKIESLTRKYQKVRKGLRNVKR